MYMKKYITLSSLHQFNSREYINKENCTTETVFFYGHKMCFVSFSMKLLKLSSNCLHKLWHLQLRSTSFRACNSREFIVHEVEKIYKKSGTCISIETHMLFTFFIHLLELYQLLIFLRQSTKYKHKRHRMKTHHKVREKIVACE